MSTQIISFDITPILMQAGYGIPDHVSSLGTEYTDLYTAIKYVNKDGILNWVQMLDITYPFSGGSGTIFTGGTVTGPTTFTAGLTANTISATTYQNLPIKYYAEYSASPTTNPLVTSADSIAIGDGAEANGINMFSVGNSAGQGAMSAYYSNFIGLNAGKGATYASSSNFLGGGAGENAINSYNSNFIGSSAGQYAQNADNSNFLGHVAGWVATNAHDSNFLGQYAGYGATNASYSNFLGSGAGQNATNANQSNFIGLQAGLNATDATSSNFIGNYAGGEATNGAYSNFMGFYAGFLATYASQSNFIGLQAGYNAINASASNFFGVSAGNGATDAYNSNFLGSGAGYQATGASYSNLFGYNVGNNDGLGSLGSNNIIIGTNISLPSATTNSLNIGGVLFGSGTYSEINGNPSITGQTSGRIGINVVNPTQALDVSGNILINGSLTANTISATTYYNLPTDISVTGSSLNPSTYDFTLTRNDGVTITSNLSLLATDMTVTGGTYNINTGIVTFTNNSGDTFNVTGFTSGMTDTYTTGGTYSNGTTTFTKTNGGTYSVTGYSTGSTTLESRLLLTDSSTGLISFDGLSFISGGTTFNVGASKCWFIDNYTDPVNPTKKYVEFSAKTGITVTNISGYSSTYVAIDSDGIIYQQPFQFQPSVQRYLITLGTVVHPTRVYVQNVNQQPVVALAPLSQLSDLIEGIGFFNISGNIFSANGTNLSINKSSGYVFKQGANFINDNKNPHTLSLSGLSPVTSLKYRLQTGVEYAPTNFIDPNYYDLNGVRTLVTGTKFTIQRINIFQSGVVRIQYGQATYANIAEAIQGVSTELFVVEDNIRENGLFRGLLLIKATTTDLSNVADALFIEAGKFGTTAGLGSLSTTNLQQAYNNSGTPEIITNSSLGAFSVQNGTGSADNITNLFEAQNSANTKTAIIRADGYISGTTLQTNGLTATTISATTYQNLPLDTRVTGGTISGNTTIFTNNTGGTFNVTGYSVNNWSLSGSNIINNNPSGVTIVHNSSNTGGYYNTAFKTQYNNGGTLTDGFYVQNGGNAFAAYLYSSFVVSTNVGADTNTYLNFGTGISTNRSGGQFTHTSGTVNVFSNSVPFVSVTGNGIYNLFNVAPTINQTGGASGITRGLYINPTLTSAYDFRAIEVITGKTYLKDVVATSMVISSSTQNILKVIGSGNSTSLPIFTVQGSQGELFSVSDSLTGSLFSVNDISGLPVLEAFSDNTVLMGSYLAPSLNTTVRIIASTGSTNIYSIPTSAYTGAFFDYTINDGTNLRGGNIMSIWSGTTIQYTETSTNDIGNTSGLTFNMIISGSSAILKTSGTTGIWTVKSIVRSI